MNRSTCVSLFTSGGIGDLAVRAAGYDVLVSSELLEDRHAVFHHNFPDTHTVTGDIRERVDDIEAATLDRLRGRPLNLLYATPPCQGMSKNGRGKLLNGVRAGTRPQWDERNRLILPVLELARRLRPEILVLENVPEMAHTVILDEEDQPRPILDLVRRALGADYDGRAEVVQFADYGVPQRRRRLITIFSRLPRLLTHLRRFDSLLPAPTHNCRGRGLTRRWVTVRDVIANLPPLDAGSDETATHPTMPFHRVPRLDETKHWWVRHTPPKKSAFDNQCADCGCTDNPAHRASRDSTGINRTSRETPLHCVACNALLPRPSVDKDGQRVLMRGYVSAYKRMDWDLPASTLTRNLSYACSDNKLHPEQHRVLSLHEAFALHTLDRYEYRWQRADGRKLSDKTIREIIGESIPPAGLQVLLAHLVDLSRHAPVESARHLPDPPLGGLPGLSP